MSHPMSYPIVTFFPCNLIIISMFIFHDWSDPIFLAPLLLLPPELCKVPRSLLHRTRMGMPKKSCDLKCGKYPPSNLFKSVQLIFVYVTLLPISAHHVDLLYQPWPWPIPNFRESLSPVIAPILRTPPLRWRAQWWANWLDSKWVVRRLGTTNIWWLIIIVHFKHCHFRQPDFQTHPDIIHIMLLIISYSYCIPMIPPLYSQYFHIYCWLWAIKSHEIPMKSPWNHH